MEKDEKGKNWQECQNLSGKRENRKELTRISKFIWKKRKQERTGKDAKTKMGSPRRFKFSQGSHTLSALVLSFTPTI